MNHPIRTVILGLGRTSAAVYVPAFQAHQRYELLAVASSRPGRASEIATARKVPRAYEDWREAIADPRVDLVVIASAQAGRAEQVREALTNRKHVLTDVPFCGDSEEASSVLEAALKSGTVAAAAFPQRYLSAHQALRELLANNHLGSARVAALRHVSGAWHRAAAVHAVDALCWTLGSAIGEVQRLDGEQQAILQMRHDGGCASQLAVEGRGATEDYSFSVSGTERMAMVVGERPESGELHVIEGDRDDEYALRPSPYQRFAAAHRLVPPLMELLDDLALAVEGKASAVPTIADAADAMEITAWA